jgi:hypothetical protein
MNKNSSTYKGVSKCQGKWRTCITINKERTYLGRFDSQIEAAKAYDEAARKYHGEFPELNFPGKK